jgi:hypothetical protein
LGLLHGCVCLNNAKGKPMNSRRNAHIVVVYSYGQGQGQGQGQSQSQSQGQGQGLVLMARLRRMALAQVTAVAGLAEARGLCQRGEVQVCIVVRNDREPDQIPVRMPADATAACHRSCLCPRLQLMCAKLLAATAIWPLCQRILLHACYIAVSDRPCNVAAQTAAAAAINRPVLTPASTDRSRFAGIDGRFAPLWGQTDAALAA